MTSCRGKELGFKQCLLDQRTTLTEAFKNKKMSTEDVKDRKSLSTWPRGLSLASRKLLGFMVF